MVQHSRMVWSKMSIWKSVMYEWVFIYLYIYLFIYSYTWPISKCALQLLGKECFLGLTQVHRNRNIYFILTSQLSLMQIKDHQRGINRELSHMTFIKVSSLSEDSFWKRWKGFKEVSGGQSQPQFHYKMSCSFVYHKKQQFQDRRARRA